MNGRDGSIASFRPRAEDFRSNPITGHSLEALAKAISSRGVIRSFRTDLNLALCGEEAREKQPIGLRARRRDVVQQPIFRERPLFGAQASAGDRWDSTTRARFARRCVERRLPRSRDNGRCSPVLYGRVGAGEHEGCQSCDRFE